jgi:hypothetical protein
MLSFPMNRAHPHHPHASHSHPLLPNSIYVSHFQMLAASFALRKKLTPCLSIFCSLFSKNTGGSIGLSNQIFGVRYPCCHFRPRLVRNYLLSFHIDPHSASVSPLFLTLSSKTREGEGTPSKSPREMAFSAAANPSFRARIPHISPTLLLVRESIGSPDRRTK